MRIPLFSFTVFVALLTCKVREPMDLSEVASAPKGPPDVVYPTPECRDACAKPNTDRAKAICYSCKCKAAMKGSFPQPEEYRCSRGNEIKIMTARADGLGNVVEAEEQGSVPKKCLNPALLKEVASDAACLQGSRLGQLERNGVFFKWICRRKADLSHLPTLSPLQEAAYVESLRDPLKNVKFEDWGMIAYNPENGVACFWDDYDEKIFNGEYIPDIDLTGKDPRKVDQFLTVLKLTEGVGCTYCHDNDPFMFSPYLRYANWRSSPTYLKGDYYLLHAAGPPTAVVQESLESPEVEQCTSCHRITSKNTCEQWAKLSLGDQSTTARPWDPVMATNPAFMHHLFWMPPKSASAAAKIQVEKLTAVRTFINQCCADFATRKDPRCVWRPVND